MVKDFGLLSLISLLLPLCHTTWPNLRALTDVNNALAMKNVKSLLCSRQGFELGSLTQV